MLFWHSYETRCRAADLIDAGCGAAFLSSSLALSRAIAEKWVHAYRAVGREVFLSMGSKHRTYDYGTKLSAVTDFVDGGLSKQDVMARHGILSQTSLERWIRDYRSGGAKALEPKAKGRPRNPEAQPRTLSHEQELEARVRKLEAENAYLKKLAALRAEETLRTGSRPRW